MLNQQQTHIKKAKKIKKNKKNKIKKKLKNDYKEK